VALLLALAGPAAAQLAGGPSPMYHHDERHTGQSHLLGPLFATGAPAAADVTFWQGTDKIRTSPALSADGSTLYVGQGFDFYAIDTATMATNWRFRLHADVSDSSPAVGIDGTIYIGDRDNTLSAFNPNGTIKFQINHGFEGDIWTHP
jgi:outer membrane protein assembly factor BamB